MPIALIFIAKVNYVNITEILNFCTKFDDLATNCYVGLLSLTRYDSVCLSL